ncbi:hypothetical protein [Paenibacillus sp. V4I7]|uniref:hypothetical protein n=1 Tax=Paenibacillus sp. V4I7 TaxID=3042307 RepID=UPI00278A97B7|nr:hypothetical protein [Paenibacillus sp. V4I7]MDQ0902753.1 hypothetical protein [Paenibacillus sp. V4I7]
MALSDKIKQLPKWSRNEANKWADFIELSCMKSDDKFMSIDDMLDHYADENPEEMDRGSWEHSSKYDKIYSDIEGYFSLIEFRARTLGKYYPFEITSDKSIALKSNQLRHHTFYFFLLCASNLSFFDKSTGYYLTHAFEDISCYILRAISSPYANTHVFGTSRSDTNNYYEGNLRQRISTLANNLSAITSKPFDMDSKYDVPAGDGGLDLVSFTSFDNMPFIPFSFGQCACSNEEWEEKQSSIKPDTWLARLNNIAPYLQYTFVPFYCRRANGEFENVSVINTCVIDRHRIFKIARRAFFKKFAKHSIFNKIEELVNN